MTSLTPEQLQQLEMDLEAEATHLGAARFMKRVEYGLEGVPAGRDLVKVMVAKTTQAIATWVSDSLDGRPGPMAGLAKFVSQLDAQDVAFLTARAALRAFSHVGAPVTQAALALTKEIELATSGEALRKADPKGFKRLQTKVAKSPFPGKRYVLVRKAMEAAKVERISWDLSSRARVGRLLLELCAEASGLFEIVLETKGVKTTAVLKTSVENLAALDQRINRSALDAPMYLPMVVPPREWSNPWNGGYLDRTALRLKIVNGKGGTCRAYLEELKNQPMPLVYRALNAVQATPWRINTRVFNTLRQAWDGDLPLVGLPPRDLLPLPVAPWGEGLAPTEEARKAYGAALGATYERNENAIADRRIVQSKLWIAEKFAAFDRFYFPHVLDWRGRLYPVPTHVNPQGDDTGRALLEFADAVALGEDGAFWLAVHGANTYGIDKVPYQERADWVDAHTAEIVACAADPLSNRFWQDAGDPWLFLAFAFEYAALVKWVEGGEDQQRFLSRLPVSWDGSCNGLQNFSAMLRDPVGGKATNLLPTDSPADIYAEVAKVASARIEADAAAGEVNAVYWLGKVDRKVAKRPTMTMPYGSGKYGFRDQTRAMLKDYKRQHGVNLVHGDEFLCSAYLGNVLYDSLGSVVVAARSAMDWLKAVSQVASQESLPIWWTTPSGFLARQEYKELLGKRIQLTLNGREVTFILEVEGDRLDKRKQAQGISPNFVHSLDAAHLHRTVAMAVDNGMTSFAMVHDSYGTHAAHAAKLHAVLRESFIEQYSAHTLQEFRDEIAAQLSEKLRAKLPPVPPMGTLELDQVRFSDYFFA